MTEEAAMLQHAALTTVTADALSVDRRCKQGHLQEWLAVLTHSITVNGSRRCYRRQHNYSVLKWVTAPRQLTAALSMVTDLAVIHSVVEL